MEHSVHVRFADNPSFSEKGTMELLYATRYYAKQSAVLTSHD